jgi:hypothetical protein
MFISTDGELRTDLITLSETKVDEALLKIEKGVRKYCWIQDNVHCQDVSRSLEFQRTYNGFYRVRRNAEWQAHYYCLMEESKGRGLKFSDALHILKEQTSKYEASFASKIVATLHPNKPVLDKYILKNCELKLPFPQASNREAKINYIYNKLCDEFEKYMRQPIAELTCNKFSFMYPWAKISNLKKVDFVLWQIR